ncbi:adenylate kinase family enzyme [Isoptericola jiangsuensis]|uniref:Adenylate kinase family enzyme n=1 Tax=Isoptericola jiangsuensis TaxID=548579 RepID=A0A2A9ERU8_9MICO|nr:AAA family ATPase [Isoptericola jiangsuensis]PFG41473.1 adenylate kinase family enzyme [Isoptericola jiangsuensis]
MRHDRPRTHHLGPDGPRARRVLVAGTAGAGKTTLARHLGRLLDLPHVELDGLFHGPGWVPRPEFMDEVRSLAASDAWVTEWQYQPARPILLRRAELLVWLDLPVHVVMRQVLRRTISRRIHRTVLWNGNVEPPLWTILRDEEHVVRWAWTTRHKFDRLDERLADDAPHVTVVRLRSRREADRWLAGLAAR